METPDKWVVIKITSPNDKPLYKVFASWYGGYLGQDSWRINSGIKIVEDCETYFNFIGYSGSCYQCRKGTYGCNIYTKSVLNNILKMAEKANVIIEVLPESIDWLKLLK